MANNNLLYFMIIILNHIHKIFKFYLIIFLDIEKDLKGSKICFQIFLNIFLEKYYQTIDY